LFDPRDHEEGARMNAEGKRTRNILCPGTVMVLIAGTASGGEQIIKAGKAVPVRYVLRNHG
jgi:hypothetical protein